MFGFIGWIIMGLVVGALAKFIMPGDDPGGIIVTIILGIAGAAIVGFIGSTVGIGTSGILSWVLAVAGSLLLLYLYRMFVGRGKKG